MLKITSHPPPPSPTTIAAVQDTSPQTNSNAVGDGILRPYSSRPQWKDKKFGFVPDAKRRISLFGNKLLPDFYESFKVRAGSNVQLMKRMFIAERDRQYNITVDIEQLENRFQYLLSDNPACAGRFLCDDYKPNPHDDSNITRYNQSRPMVNTWIK